jgi:phosphotransferase system IIA component
MDNGVLAALLELGRKVRHAESVRELQFVLVNDSHALTPYRQAALWFTDGGVGCLSGLLQVEANVPYVLWLDGICRQFAAGGEQPRPVGPADLTEAAGAEWSQWLPAHGLWLPLSSAPPGDPAGGLLLARDLPWLEHEIALLAEWIDTWLHAWQARQPRSRRGLRGWLAHLRGASASRQGRRWWQRPALRWSLAVVLLGIIPVRLSVLAPGELVPAQPAVIRAPLDGVIDTFHVQPNQPVSEGQPLFGFDEALIQSRLDVTRQALATAEAEYRQAAQQALSDPRAKAQLSLLTGKIAEKEVEQALVSDQLARARVLAPRDGVALFDDPSEWIGKPVAIGERIMRIAAPADVEIEAWVPLADAIPLPEQASVALHLNASPLAAVDATLRYQAHDAVQRPDGNYAYRLRARLDGPTEHRVGLKGTARLNGRWVPLVYWVLRRPLASLRAATGW